MSIALIADVFPPLRSSGAAQLRDLALEFVKQGHQPSVIVASPELKDDWHIEAWQGVEVVRLRSPKTKDVNYLRRTLGEFLMPFSMIRALRRSPLANRRWDGVVWYSPSIFLGPVASVIKRENHCRSYLILRDIFPEWAVDMGLMGRGLPYRFFKTVENFQYSVADVIGVHSHANVQYLDAWAREPGHQVEVLQNWLASAPNVGCSIRVADTGLAGRKIFVYAGNMGIAQGMGLLLDLAERLLVRSDIGFLFVGRGSDVQRLRSDAVDRALHNVLFFDEIDPTEIAGLYSQCHVGLVALDPRHRTHNVPGKFISYMEAGLPVLASVNPGNDLAELILSEQVGQVCTDASVNTLFSLAESLVAAGQDPAGMRARCKKLAESLYSPGAAVSQILQALAPQPRITAV